MGCWCETCGITKLPINYGDPIVMIPLYGHGDTDYVYNDSAYQPMWMPFFGTYDDYGSIENIENTESLKQFYNIIKKHLKDGNLTLKQDDHDKLSKPEGLPRIIERGYLTAESPAPWISEGHIQHFEVNQFMCHRSAFEALVDEVGQRKPYSKKKSYRKLLESDLSNQARKHKKYLACDPKDRFLEFRDYNKQGIFSYFNELGKADMSPALMWYLEEQPEGLKDQILDFICFKTAMSYGRMEWRPQIGRGSQSEERAIQRIIAKQINALTEKNKKEFLEETVMEEGEEYSFGETIFWRD